MIRWSFLLSLLLFLCGCSSASINSPDPDMRFKALHKMASSKEVAQYFPLFMELVENDKDTLVRAQSAYYLGKFHHKPAVPVLINALNNSNVFVRQEAVWALGEIKDNSAVDVLIRLLEKDTNMEVRRRCADALKKINDPKSIDGLIEQLDDVNPSVAYASLSALREITKQDFGNDIKLWEKWKESQK
ncbi:MAG: HEAT repeat domain-containing protein [Planctomycetota bacterium]|nr:HEAT repeat domain-containing protein [Planctomycetota bacterium]MDI6787023.1 HEAT repeat domain-containing protein [Planctomycetota bacterium]